MSNDTSQWIDIGPDPGFRGLFTGPFDKVERKGALVLIQEIFGINANMRATAEVYAAHGYAVLVPDLFWRNMPGITLDPAVEDDRKKAMGLNDAFDDITGLSDLRTSVAVLRQKTGVEDVASVGFCLGGRLSFALGAAGDVARAVSYYGVNLKRYVGVEHRSPTLVHLAQNDALCPPDAQQFLLDHFKGNLLVELIVHPGVGHAFSRLGSGAYAVDAARAAQEQTLHFLNGER